MKLILFFTLCMASLFGKSQTNSFPTVRDTLFPHTVNSLNEYAAILSFAPCGNKLKVDDASNYGVGDTVLIIQMKGAVIDSSNTSSFGNIIDYHGAGNYEFNYIKAKVGNTIVLKNNLTKHYDIPQGLVQLIRVPSFISFVSPGVLTCDPWDGSKGGVFAIIVDDTLELTADIDVSGNGFKGGANDHILFDTMACFQNDFYYDSASWQNARKGEGITSLQLNKRNGKGNYANGGGGGNGQNSGGGGGSNNTRGGFGGYQLDSCGSAPFDNRGIGGAPLNYSNSVNKIFLGGGGGAGQMDSPHPFFIAAGGNGAGIVIIKAKYLRSNNHQISAVGFQSQFCISCTNDGAGGGGGGGTILMDVQTYLDSLKLNLYGGEGGLILNYTNPLDRVGPGGGGSGGVVWFTGTTPLNSVITKGGGPKGVIYYDSANPWGATDGSDGTILNGLKLPFDTILFVHNIDSVKIKDSAVSCSSYNFQGTAFINSFPISQWIWDFGDSNFDSTQNTIHNYTSTGSYPVNLSVTDSYGCSSYASTTVNSYYLSVDAGTNDTICEGESLVIAATNTGATQFSWTPAQFLNDSSVLNPIANPPVTTMYYLTGSVTMGCLKTDSVLISVRQVIPFSLNPSFSICKNDSAILLATGGTSYLWSPGNDTTSNLVIHPASSTLYDVLISDTICHLSTTLSTQVIVNPLPDVHAVKSSDVDCYYDYIQLNATGAGSYQWSPATLLNDPTIPDPIAFPKDPTQYIVIGLDSNGCIGRDSLMVTFSNNNKSGYSLPLAFTPNGDGLNDCFKVTGWGIVENISFEIYNRWSQLVFHSTKPRDCWDGTFRGKQQPQGTYVYIIKAQTSCGEVSKQGTVLLLR